MPRFTDDEKREFGSRLKAQLQKRGWSSSRLATELGTARHVVWRYLEGENIPHRKRLGQMCRILGVTPAELFSPEATHAHSTTCPHSSVTIVRCSMCGSGIYATLRPPTTPHPYLCIQCFLRFDDAESI